MLPWEKELFETMESDGLEIIQIDDLGLELENTPVTHAIAMEHWKTHEPSVMFTNGNPADKNAIYWDNSMDKDGKHDFENACEYIVKHF